MHWTRRFLLTLFFLPVTASVAAPLVMPTSADISVSSIFLYDTASQKSVLGTDIPFDRQADIPMAVFASTDGRQSLTVFTHPGEVGEIAEFRVSYVSGAESPVRRLAGIKKFITGKGINLGMSQSQVTSILGAPSNQQSKENLATFNYRIEGVELNKSKFLAYYNMPIYYGIYKFKNNRLVSFQFGFEYP